MLTKTWGTSVRPLPISLVRPVSGPINGQGMGPTPTIVHPCVQKRLGCARWGRDYAETRTCATLITELVHTGSTRIDPDEWQHDRGAPRTIPLSLRWVRVGTG
jgi:hypothetical protein